MSCTKSFAPIVCVVGFHHARSILEDTPCGTMLYPSTDPCSEAPKSRVGSASKRAVTPYSIMTGVFCPSWHCPTEPTRTKSQGVCTFRKVHTNSKQLNGRLLLLHSATAGYQSTPRDLPLRHILYETAGCPAIAETSGRCHAQYGAEVTGRDRGKPALFRASEGEAVGGHKSVVRTKVWGPCCSDERFRRRRSLLLRRDFTDVEILKVGKWQASWMVDGGLTGKQQFQESLPNSLQDAGDDRDPYLGW